jgi:hypothetical protein
MIRQPRTENFMSKKRGFDAGQIWSDLLGDLRIELEEHCSLAKADELRFQTGRLAKNLRERIPAAGKHPIVDLFLCYRFVTDESVQFGYDEPRRLHAEEMQAVGFKDSASSFCRSIANRYAKAPARFAGELIFRLESIASFMEAQESFSQWLAFRHHRAAWRGDDPSARAQAMQAWHLAELRSSIIETSGRKGWKFKGARLGEVLGIGCSPSDEPWNDRQWANILEQAARLVRKGESNCTALEKWIWWCYPVFVRHGWNSREVQEAAERRFSRVPIREPEKLRRHLMSIGLRIAGRKKKRKRLPPLAEFVEKVRVPDLDVVRGVPIWG